MARLPETHPPVHEAFMAGKFVVQRGDKKSSLMALDQSQEHSIQFLKVDSGAKGLYGQQESKEVIELSKPEVLRAIDEFECACFSASTPNESMPAPGCSKAVKAATVVILDMAAVIHIIKTQRARIFGEYTQMQLLHHMQSQMTENTSRVDAIWDTYQEASLQSQTRAKREPKIESLDLSVNDKKVLLFEQVTWGQKLHAVEQKHLALDQQQQDLDQKHQTLDQQQQDLDQMHQTLDQQQQDLDQKHQTLDQQQQDLDQKHQTLDQQQQDLDQKHQTLDQQQQDLIQKHQTLDQQQQDLDQKHQMLDQQQQDLHQKHQTLDQQQQDLDQKHQTLDQQQQDLIQKHQTLDQQQQDLHQKHQTLDQQQQDLDQKHQTLDQKLQDLDQKQSLTTEEVTYF
ncbi:hypothetical protein NP493_139g01005 [Ridgeia piscesae]|uniref:Uncharacterized protein n=1 Tax=Ridgeia piscesae TaxID=27915 RepID=A0AAD9P4X2_RIDPI|nr:hypothetical protein NP493_139g01005 [Ridgeia piscesae]